MYLGINPSGDASSGHRVTKHIDLLGRDPALPGCASVYTSTWTGFGVGSSCRTQHASTEVQSSLLRACASGARSSDPRGIERRVNEAHLTIRKRACKCAPGASTPVCVWEAKVTEYNRATRRSCLQPQPPRPSRRRQRVSGTLMPRLKSLSAAVSAAVLGVYACPESH